MILRLEHQVCQLRAELSHKHAVETASHRDGDAEASNCDSSDQQKEDHAALSRMCSCMIEGIESEALLVEESLHATMQHLRTGLLAGGGGGVSRASYHCGGLAGASGGAMSQECKVAERQMLEASRAISHLLAGTSVRGSAIMTAILALLGALCVCLC